MLFQDILSTAAPVYFELPFHKVDKEEDSISQPVTDAQTSLTYIILAPCTVDQIINQVFPPLKSKTPFDPLSQLPDDVDRKYLHFPFLTNESTVRHINRGTAKILFVMRGLSGSGKSTIVNTVKSSYKVNTIVCSADHFFQQDDGSYKFDEKLLGSAHLDCQTRARQACQAGIPVVVIDNTNVKQWEMKPYFNIGNTNGYVTVLVEPKTSWRMNAEILAERNSHGVNVELLRRKVKDYENKVPSYYGWFLTQDNSSSLLNLSRKLFTECLERFPAFKQYLLLSLGIKLGTIDEETGSAILDKYFSRRITSGPLLHCTAKFCGRGKAPGSEAYHHRSDVREACGKMFTLYIPGVVFTAKTMGGRVTLNSECLSLFCKPEEAGWDGNSAGSSKSPQAGFCKTTGAVRRTDSNSQDEQFSKSKKKLGKKATAKLDRKMKKQAKKSAAFLEGGDDKGDVCQEENVNSKEHLYHVKKRLDKDGMSGTSNLSLETLSCDVSLDDMNSSSLSNDLNILTPGEEIKEENHNDTNFFHKEKENARLNLSNSCENSLSGRFPGINFQNAAKSAHITLGTAEGIQASETNFDLLRTCDIEKEASQIVLKRSPVCVSHGQAYYYGNGICCVYFDKPLKVKTIFSGYY